MPVLLVDDDENLLSGLKRKYRKDYDLATACGGENALSIIAESPTFAVVVSDYRMPGMDGITFLGRVREVSPDSVRLMLTGNAEYGDAIDAVNRGNIFRFFTKPCPDDVFRSGVDAALEQYELVRSEKVLLEQTLRGSIQVLVDTLALVNPVAFGRAFRVKSYVAQLASRLEMSETWQLETAALLSQMGCVATPHEILEAAAAGQELPEEQQAIIDRQPEIARQLLAKIPRLEDVASIIASQNDVFEGSEDSPREAHVLSAALAFDALTSQGRSISGAVTELRAAAGRFDPEILTALGEIDLAENNTIVRELALGELRTSMIIDEDVFNDSEALIVPKGHEITPGTLERLRNYGRVGTIKKSIRVRVPVVMDSREPAAV